MSSIEVFLIFYIIRKRLKIFILFELILDSLTDLRVFLR